MEPLDDEIAELARAYRYCRLFGVSMSEYESRPYWETTWMLQIDDTYNQAVREKQEESQR